MGGSCVPKTALATTRGKVIMVREKSKRTISVSLIVGSPSLVVTCDIHARNIIFGCKCPDIVHDDSFALFMEKSLVVCK